MRKLFTQPWRGVLIVNLLLIFFEIGFVIVGFQYGVLPTYFTFYIAVLVILAIVIMIFIASPMILKEPFISPKTGKQVLLFFIIWWASTAIVIWIFGVNLAGWILFLLIGISLYLNSKSSSNQNLKLEGNKTPSNNSTYVSTNVKDHTESPYQIYKPKYDPNKPLHVNVENAIRSFTPSRRWQYERQYQYELYNWLKRDFPYTVGYEVQTESSRPDLVIRDIAIEIKGPTSNRELDTLTTKFLKYSNHYPYFFIVLFDCKFTERHYNDIYNGIRKHCPNVKIIRK